MMPLWTMATPFGEMRMRVGLVGHAMGRPARVADADRAVERLVLQPAFEVDELAFGAAAGKFAALDGGDAGRVIAAIFEPLQRIDDERRDRRVADNPNDSAHVAQPQFRPDSRPSCRQRLFTESPDAAEVNLRFVPFQPGSWHGSLEIALPGL